RLLVLVQVHDDGGRRAVHEVNAPLPALALDEEAAHAGARQPVQVVLLAPEREADHLDEPLPAPAQVPPQPQQALAVLAEGAEPHRQRPAVRPEELIAFKVDPVVLAVPGGIATKEYVQRS